MTRVVLLAVWLAVGATSAAAILAAAIVGQWHLMHVWANSGAIACLGWWSVRESARMERWDAFLGTWGVATRPGGGPRHG